MAYTIDTIKKDTPVKGVFFFDTNVWIHVIAPTFSNDTGSNKYISFFDKVFEGKSTKIAVTSVLISEIINTYMRQVAFKLYMSEFNTTIDPKDFKSRYRSTLHYSEHYALVCDELDQRKDKFLYLADPLENFSFTEPQENQRLDFNDFIFHKLCSEQAITFVTDDGDFFLEDISILTLNQNLYKRQFEV